MAGGGTVNETAQSVLPLIGEGVLTTAVLATMVAFHRSAVRAHARRADQWYEAWKLERRISAESSEQVTSVVSAVQQATEVTSS